MLSPAILNRSMPRTVVSGMPCPLSVSLNAYLANFHLLKISILGGQAHLRADQLFLFEPCVHNSNIGADSIEPSVYLPFTGILVSNSVNVRRFLRRNLGNR